MFGLPAPHWCYVQYIRTGMPLFLYNFDTRELHGIFKAVGPGDWEVDPLGALRWARRVRGPGGRRRRQEREGRGAPWPPAAAAAVQPQLLPTHPPTLHPSATRPPTRPPAHPVTHPPAHPPSSLPACLPVQAGPTALGARPTRARCLWSRTCCARRCTWTNCAPSLARTTLATRISSR